MDLLKLTQLLKDLIALPSVNPSFGGSGEAAVADYVLAYLEKAGLKPERQVVLDDGRDNVFVRVGEKEGPAILLEAHMDTVATEGWLSGSPFDPVETEGRIYGRGSCDTKASLAVFLAVAAHFSRQPETLRVPLVFAATIDEEEMQTGASRLMEAGLDLQAAITGEPTLLDIIHAHKGILRFKIRTEGVAAHSAFPERGENAILKMAPVLSRLAEYESNLAARPAHPTLGRPTVNVGTIRGGQAVNVVPDSCVIDIDRRLLPDETGDEVLEEVRRTLSGLGKVTVESAVLDRVGIDTPVDSPVAEALAAAVRKNKGDCQFLSAPYMTNATAYASAGIPSLVFGPGDIAQAHTRDEHVEAAQLESAFRILVDFLSR